MLVVVIGLMTLTPAPAISPFAGQATVSIQAFDVCHGSSTGINVDMPYSINERCCNLFPPLFTGVQNLPNMPFSSLLITFQDERPPA